jgi:DNA anti-recombination protein RmuC
MATVGDQFAALAFRQHKQQTELNEIKAQLGDISNQISKIVESLQRIELALNISDASQQAIPSEYNYFA